MFDTPQIDDFIIWLGGITVALVAVVGGLAGLHRIVFGPVRRDIEQIRKELHPNGGSSLRDSVDRIESRQQEILQDVKQTASRLDDHIHWHLEDK